jgi:hypothetical protein
MAELSAAERFSADPAAGPVALSQQILAEAREAPTGERLTHLDDLAAGLREVDPTAIEAEQGRTAFWLNLYNALLLHTLARKPMRRSVLLNLRLFNSATYDVGERRYTLNLIEHGILRRNRRAPLHVRRPMRPTDPRLTTAPAHVDPRIHFALNCGARSCPPIHVYDPDRLDAQLELATRAYLQAETRIDPRRPRVTLPSLLRLYAADFGDRTSQLDFAARHLPDLETCVREAGPRLKVRYGRFNWRVAPPTSSPAGPAS